MGCWNGTCGLSGLPIIHGEEMYVFPIVESFRDSFCYASALYRPTVLPFRAKYNDYGGGEECGGIGLELNMNHISSNLVEMDVGKNKYHDIAVKRANFDADTFFDACHEKRLKYDNPMKGYDGELPHNNVFFTMVRKDVVDRLWSEWTFDSWKGSGGSVPEGFESDQYYVKNVTYEKLATLIPSYLASCANRDDPKMQERLAKATKGTAADKVKLMEDFFITQYFFENQRDHLLSGSFGHAFGSGYAGGGFSRVEGLKETIIHAYMSGEEEVAYALMHECLIGIMINSFMESTRRVWLPPMHQGSQSEQYDEYLLMNKISTDVINARRSEYEDDEIEEDLFTNAGIYMFKDFIR
jgi:hypothetical protein